jgi:hypothetical protein
MIEIFLIIVALAVCAYVADEHPRTADRIARFVWRSTKAHRIGPLGPTSTVDLTQPTPAADGDQRAVLSGGSLRTGRRAGNSWRVS